MIWAVARLRLLQLRGNRAAQQPGCPPGGRAHLFQRRPHLLHVALPVELRGNHLGHEDLQSEARRGEAAVTSVRCPPLGAAGRCVCDSLRPALGARGAAVPCLWPPSLCRKTKTTKRNRKK